MILATGEGQLILLVLMGVFGVINWIAGKLKGSEQPPPKNAASGTRRAPADSEEERMRRFLEALGLPADAPVSKPKAPPVLPPQPPPQLPMKRTVATPPSLREKTFRRPAVHTPATRRSVEQTALPELALPEMPDFDTTASRITAIPIEIAAQRAGESVTDGSSLSVAVRRALASPRDLQMAFILREVLGPAPGLQS